MVCLCNVLQEELKAYMSVNPNFVPSNVKTVLTKEEKNLKERYSVMEMVISVFRLSQSINLEFM